MSLLDKQVREKMCKMLNKYVPAFDFVDKNLLVLLGSNSCVSIASFVTFIGVPVGIASVNTLLC